MYKPLLLLLAVCTLGTGTLQAQTDSTKGDIRTFFGPGSQRTYSAWGAMTGSATRLMGQDAALVGVRGGCLIGGALTLGLDLQLIASHITNPDYDQYLFGNSTTEHDNRLVGGYGGVLIEPIVGHQWPVHLSLPLVIGAGNCNYRNDGVSYAVNEEAEKQTFFVLQQGLEVELNMSHFVRLGFGFSYRYTTDIDMPETPADTWNGWSGTLALKLGEF